MVATSFTAAFDGSTDSVAVTFTGIGAAAPEVIAGDPVMTNVGDPFVVVDIDGDPTSSGCTVRATAAFVGKVNLLVIG